MSLFALLETHVKEDSAVFVSNLLCPRFSWHFNYNHHYHGRIWVGFDPDIWKLDVIFSSAQQITCSIERLSTKEMFVVSFIYAFNTHIERRQLWEELVTVQNMLTIDTAWCILGDFNVCLGPLETSSNVNWTPSMVEFKESVTQLGITDLRCTGPLFTWWDSNIASPTYKKLDRCLVNGVWLNKYHMSLASILPRGLSDHCPIAVNMGMEQERIRKPFQFFNHLINLPNFLDEVRAAWRDDVIGNPWFILTTKLRRVKDAMRKLNAEKGNLHNGVLHARVSLLDFQRSLPALPSQAQLEEENTLIQALQNALLTEEIFLKQKSRVMWLKHGDGNNKFFFNACRGRWNQNKILQLDDDLGNTYTTHSDISRVATDYYSSLFGQSTMVTDLPQDLPLPHLSDIQRTELLAPFSSDDVLQTLKNMAKGKCPGPDGWTAEFYLATWSVIGSDVSRGVLYFFHSRSLPRIVCSTAITLVPKQQHPTTMSDFRPIACCNILYKCITKMLASRLKKIMPGLISPYQSAFVPQRLIGDNILLAQALFKNYHLNSGQPRCAIKLDIRKAFDTLNWDFLLRVLQRMGFPPLFTEWIMVSIKSCMISIKINGSLEGFFKAESGLRQGDPLSPYLFVIAMEALTACLAKSSASANFKHHWQTKTLSITHISFADDVMLFSYGDEPSVQLLMEGVNAFSAMSGLHPNKNKSSCFFANVAENIQHIIITSTGFQLGSLPVRYLGLPLISTKLTQRDCSVLIRNICDRIETWTSKLLNHSGRMQLLKIILFGMQNFWSLHLYLPKAVLKQLQSIFVKFLWGGTASNT